MNAEWLVSTGGACVGVLATYQTLFATKVSEATMILRLLLYAVKAVLLMAVGRPHPKVTNWLSKVGNSLSLYPSSFDGCFFAVLPTSIFPRRPTASSSAAARLVQ